MDIRFTEAAFADYQWWQKHDPKLALRIKKLCQDIVESPFEGIGKPEPLKYDLQGYWSRRINKTHRLVYKIEKDHVLILSCRFHY